MYIQGELQSSCGERNERRKRDTDRQTDRKRRVAGDERTPEDR